MPYIKWLFKASCTLLGQKVIAAYKVKKKKGVETFNKEDDCVIGLKFI